MFLVLIQSIFAIMASQNLCLENLEKKLPKFLINGKKVGRPFNLPFYINVFMLMNLRKL